MDRYWLGVLTVPLLAAAVGLLYVACKVTAAAMRCIVERWPVPSSPTFGHSDGSDLARLTAKVATARRVWGIRLPGDSGVLMLVLRPRWYWGAPGPVNAIETVIFEQRKDLYPDDTETADKD